MTENEDLSKYDALLDNLIRDISNSPEDKSTIIMQAITKTECPYLKYKMMLLVPLRKSDDSKRRP